MTASVGREVDANLLPGAALGSAQARPDAQDTGGQDLGDLVQALGRGHEIGVESVEGGAVAPGQMHPLSGWDFLSSLYSRGLTVLPAGADPPFGLDSMFCTR